VTGRNISVIDTASNMVATVVVDVTGVAVTPDGKHAYVTTNKFDNTVLVIDTASNMVVATVLLPSGSFPEGVAVAPDGKHVYVANSNRGTVSVIDTATNTVVGTPIPVGFGPFGIAVTPDGKHAYVTNASSSSNNVSVIDTASNTAVGAPIPVGSGPFGVAITPDGKHVYVANRESVPGTVSVIDTGSNIVVAGPPTTTPFTVGNGPIGVGITPPVQFRALSATLDIHFGGAPNQDTFNWHSQFTLSSTASNGINPVTEPVTLQVGTFGTTIPPGSFTKNRNGSFTFAGGDRWREPECADQADGHFALRVPHGGDWRELDRYQEPGAGDIDHRRRQRLDLGQGPHPLDACFKA